MGENKKVIGATQVSAENIQFKSKLERSCYLKLREAGLQVSYEPERVVIWEGKKLEKVLNYSKNNGSQDLELSTRTLLPITYTPDMKVTCPSLVCYIEIKGFANDRYPIKKKMFLKWLEEKNDNIQYVFFEIYSVRQILQAITIIQNYAAAKQD